MNTHTRAGVFHVTQSFVCLATIKRIFLDKLAKNMFHTIVILHRRETVGER